MGCLKMAKGEKKTLIGVESGKPRLPMPPPVQSHKNKKRLAKKYACRRFDINKYN